MVFWIEEFLGKYPICQGRCWPATQTSQFVYISKQSTGNTSPVQSPDFYPVGYTDIFVSVHLRVKVSSVRQWNGSMQWAGKCAKIHIKSSVSDPDPDPVGSAF